MLKERIGKFWAKLMKKYRLVLYDHESLSQSRNFLVRPLGVILLISGLTFATILGTSLLIFKVPAIHERIPGFKKPQLTKDYKVLQAKNDELSHKVERMDTLLASFARIASMNNPTADDRAIWEAAAPEPGNASPPSVNAGKEDPSGQEMTPPTLPTHIQPERVIRSNEPQTLNLIPPVDGYISLNFDTQEKKHFGIDLVARENSMIRSVADGVVIFSEYSNTTGFVIGIWHSQYNLVSFYKHNSRLFKPVGSYVFAGQAIAVIGNTGIYSDGLHLHFELWYDNNPVNPADYIIFN
ncbi:MAG TPA: hypothetical protein ENJ82_04150 [Bacteroidetes bacterium]|nr:hypothetical protein [Bacteroidota bacterium]